MPDTPSGMTATEPPYRAPAQAEDPVYQPLLELLAEAKRILPLPRLLERIGDARNARPKSRCPFHEDKDPSFSIYRSQNGEYRWKCHAGCGTGDGVAFMEKRFHLKVRDSMVRYIREAGLGHKLSSGHAPQRQVRDREQAARVTKAFDWEACVEALGPEEVQRVAAWRGFSVPFVEWLRRRKIAGLLNGKLAFPVHGEHGSVVSCHYLADEEKRRWAYFPTGQGTRLLILGSVGEAERIFLFESQWDAFAVMDKLGWHEADGIERCAVVVTRGAENGRKVQGLCPAGATAYAFVQNDPPRETGPTAAEKWLSDIAANIGCALRSVSTPLLHKDVNDWTRATAKREDIDGALRAATLVPKAIQAAAENPSPNEDEIKVSLRGEIISVYESGLKAGAKSTAIANLVVDALEKLGAFYFHADLKNFSTAMFFNAHRKRLEQIGSDFFKAWLSEFAKVNPASPTFNYIVKAVGNAALCGKKTKAIVPEAYWAARGDTFYLSNGDGQMAKIAADGVNLVDNGTDGVLFAAGKTLQPWKLTTPRSAFETCSLFKGIQCSAEHGPDLLMLWVYSLPACPQTKPPLCLAGDIGSGKTRLARGIAELFGIPFCVNKVEDEGEKDFWTAINAGGLVTLDNADTRCRWLPDALAAAATGGSTQRRRLYTDDVVISLFSRAFIAITTAEPTFASDAGLADRLLVVRMSRRVGDTSDAALTSEVMAARDEAISHIVQILHAALGDGTPTPEGLNRRHPDFAALAVKIGRALGREMEAVAALEAAEADKSAFCLENDPIATALIGFLRQEGFTGTAAELKQKLIVTDSEMEKVSPRRLGKHLCKIWTHLESVLGSINKELNNGKTLVFTFPMQGLPGLEE